MKSKTPIFTCTLTIFVFACPVFSQTDSNRPDMRLTQEPLSALADVNSVWISREMSKTPGVPYIPDPRLDHEKIQERLKLAGINLVGVPLLNRNPDAPLPACLRIKIYIHSFDDPDSYIFHIEVAVARPVVIPAVMDSPFYAEVWHTNGVIGVASKQDLQDKINKALVGQLDFIIPASKAKKSVYFNYPSLKDPNRPSPKLNK